MTLSRDRVTWIVLALLLGLAPAATAQTRAYDMPAGARIRVSTGGPAFQEIVGTYLETRHDSLFVQVDVWPRPVGVPIAAITLIERSTGFTSHGWKGAMIGAGIGFGAGIAIASSSNSGDGTVTREQIAEIIGSTALGVGLGYLIGSLVKSERWVVAGNQSSVAIVVHW